MSDAMAATAEYEVAFAATLVPTKGIARVTLTVAQQSRALRTLDLIVPTTRYSGEQGDGVLERRDDRLSWTIPTDGGSLSIDYLIDRRKGTAYEARVTDAWAILRLDDLFPRASARTVKGARGHFSVQLSGPDEWAFESQYGDVAKQKDVPNPQARKFVRPIGWLAAGKLGVRREKIGEHRVVVAAPAGSHFRRLDTIAMLRWSLPTFLEVFPGLPQRLLIAGAPGDMWRGALSGPGSFYLHTSLPMISENGTSILIHELVHVAGLHSAEEGDDWIVEGLAEYYSVELVRRAGGMSDYRFELVMDDLAAWVARKDGKIAHPSRGADTAAATLLFRDLATELDRAGGSLDAIVRDMVTAGTIDRDTLASAVSAELGQPSRVLAQVER
jgi:hypothetical protein